MREVELEKAVQLLDKGLTVFYSYDIGKHVWVFEESCIKTAILSKARFFTPCSFLEEE